jgi:membrane-associated protease RseP (regulator of RpoE activity)
VDELVPVAVDDGPPAPFVLDTGFPMALRISPHLAKGQNLLVGRPSVAILAGGIGGSAPGQIASVRRLSLGGVGFSNVPVMFSDAWPAASFTDRVQGLLGVALLSRFRVIADWPAGLLYLIPAPAAIAAPFARDRLGLAWTADGEAMRVTGVQPGSPAARAGLKSGEIIETVNGKPAVSAGNVGALPAGTQLKLVARSPAASTTVTLSDYY